MARALVRTIPEPVVPAIMNSQVFDESGTFNVPAGVTRVKLSGRGGAGGGGGGADFIAGAAAAGGGGGQGVTSEDVWIDVTPLAAISVIIGAGGTGGTGTNISSNTTGGTGGTGGTSSFGDVYFRNVGGPATGGAQNTGAGGVGGSSGAFNTKGGNGGNGGTYLQTGIVGSGGIFALTGGVGGVRTGNNGGGGGGGGGDNPPVAPDFVSGHGGRSNVRGTTDTLVRSNNIVTAHLTGPHGMFVGTNVQITNASPTSFNSANQTSSLNAFRITGVPDASTLVYEQAGIDEAGTSSFVSYTNGNDGQNGLGGGGGGGAQNTNMRGGCGGHGSPGQIVVSW